MLFLNVLLHFVLFSTSAATSQAPITSSSSQPSQPDPGFDIRCFYWLPPSAFGAKGQDSQSNHPVIAIDKVPDEFGQPEGLVFVAELWNYLPLEDKYKKNANEYFSPGAKLTTSTGKKYDLSKLSINVGFAQFTTIKKLVSLPGRHKRSDGQPGGPQMKEEFRKAIYNSMLDDFRNRITKGLLILDFNSPSLGQVFRPYIQTGYIYWLSPAELGFTGTSTELHPISPVGRVEQEENTGHDLYYVTMLSENLPLRNEFTFSVKSYFPKGAALSTKDGAGGLNFQKSKLVSRFALVAESGAFCYQRNEGVEQDLEMLEGKPEEIYKMMQNNAKSRKLVDSLNFNNKRDLGQSILMSQFLKMQGKSEGQGAGGNKGGGLAATTGGNEGGGSATKGGKRGNKGGK